MRKAKLENECAFQKKPRRETQGRAQRFEKIWLCFCVCFCWLLCNTVPQTPKHFWTQKRVNQDSFMCNFRCKQVRTPSVLHKEPEKKHKSKCLLQHLSSLQQHDAGPGMGQVYAVAALEKCQICCCVLLHLRLTAYSVAMLLPFAQLPSCINWLITSSALEVASITNTTSNKIKATLTRKLFLI